MRRRTAELERQLEMARARVEMVIAFAVHNSTTMESQANALELLASENEDLKLENQGLMVEAELRDQQLASLMDMVAERNRYTEHLGAMDVSRVTDPVAVLEATVREARDLTHEYATAVHVVQEELEFSGR